MKKILWRLYKLKSDIVQGFSFLPKYRYFGVMLLLLFSAAFMTQAQPVNDNLGAAQLITINNYCSADAEFTTIGATSDGVAPSCWNTAPDRNVWFTFQATTNEVNVTVRRGGVFGSIRRINVAIFESDGTTAVACKRYIGDNDNVILGATALVPGNWYYISVDNNYAPYAGTFTLCADDEVDYDFIEGAIDITDISDWCSADAEYSTYGATADIGEVQPSCWNTNPDYSRWFRFTATNNMINITVKRGPSGTIRRINAAIFESDGTTVVSCNRYINNNDSVVVGSVDLIPGNTYYLSVDNNYSGYRGSFMLCFDDQMDYDYIEGAKDVTSLINSCSNDAEFTTMGATSPASETAPPCWNTGPNYTRWFKFVATKPAINVEVKRGGVFGTIRRVNLALYEDDGTTVLNCNRYVFNDDNVEVGYEGLTVGAWYYIAVDNNYSGYRGTFTLCLDDDVSYDYYEGALELGLIDDWSSADAAYTTLGATGDRLAASTWNTNPDFNRWFKFTATTNNIYLEVKRGGVFGTIRRINAAIWQADGMTEVASNRYINNDDNVVVQSMNLIPGNVYYISVDNNYSGYRGTFSLYLNDELDYDFYEGAKDITHLINSSSDPGEYTTLGATQDKVPPPPCWNTGPNYNRWFKFQASSPGINLKVRRGGALGTIRRINAAIFEADGTTVLSCNRYISNNDDVEVSYEGLTVGNWYYISVDNNYGPYRGTFTIELDDEVSYDFYEGAIELTDIHNWESAPAEYTTRGATSDKLPGTCWNTSPNFNRWFKFVATTPVISVEVKKGGIYGDIRRINAAIWEADGTTPVACNRYVGNDDNVSVGSKSLTPGNTYYISVDNNYAPYRGSFTLAVTDEMDYDFYEGAYEITDLNNWQSADAEFSTIGATRDLNPASCWNTAPNYNRWFKFQAISPDVTIQVLRGGALGTVRRINAALWEADGVTEIACNRYGANDDNITISNSGLTVGNWYYIAVDNNYAPYRGSFTLAVNNVSGNEFWAIADGTWDNSITWSYTEGGLPVPLGTIPTSANIVHIGGYTVTVNAADAACAELLMDVKNNTTGLIVNGYNLVVPGKATVTNPGNNIDGFIRVTGGGSLTVNDNLEFNRDGGDNSLRLNISSNTSAVNVLQDLVFNSTAGSVSESQIIMSDASLLEITNSLVFNHSGGQKIFLGAGDNAVVRVLNDIEFIATAVDMVEVELSQTSSIELGRNIVRGTTAYGILNCLDNSTLVFNSADNLQLIPANAGEGTDGFTFQNIEVNNTRITTPQISTEGDAVVNGDLNLISGVIQTETGKVLTLASGASLTGGGINSYIDGPFEKIGNIAFRFPIGKDGLYQPVSISAPALSTDAFTAEYFNEDPDVLYSRSLKEVTLDNIADVEYWTVDRSAGASNVTVTLEWDGDGSCVGDLPTLAVAAWDGTEWTDLGNASTTGDILNGTILSSGTVAQAANPVTFGNPYAATDFGGLGGPYCQDALPVTLTGTPTDANGTFTGPGISDNGDGTALFDPFIAGSGIHTITYTYTPPTGCGGFTSMDVEVYPAPTASVTGTAIICEGVPTDISMFFSGTAPWDVTYTDGTDMFNVITSSNPYIISTSVPGTYEVTDLIDGFGCVGTEFGSSAVITTYSQPLKPIISVVTGVPDFCIGDSVTLEAPAADFYYWSNSVITQQNVIKATGNYTVQVYNTDGCLSEISDPFAVNAYEYPVPTLISSDADNAICAGESVVFTAGGGSIYEFFVNGGSVQSGASDSYTTATLVNNDDVTVTVTDANGCTDTHAGITMTVNANPTATLVSDDADNIICPSETVTFTASGGVNYDFLINSLSVQNGLSDTYITNTLADNDIVTVTVTDINACVATSNSIVMTVEDLIPPVPDIATLADVTAECTVTILTAPTATDNCVGAVTGTHNATLPIQGEGTTVVTWTYDDGNGNTSTQLQNVIIDDVTDPTASNPASINVECVSEVPAPNITDVVDAADNCGTVTVAWVDDVSDGNTCPEIITRTYSVSDATGNSIQVEQTIIINDITAPNVVGQNIIVQLDASGVVSITAADIDNGSTDNCGIESMWLDVYDFDCTNVGPNAVNLFVSDICGTVSSWAATVTVEDNIPPVITCPGDETHTALAGSCSVVVNGIAPVFATDNCSNATVTYRLEGATTGSGVVDASGSAFEKGITTVWYIITDPNSNADSCSFDITVLTTIVPPDNAFSSDGEVCPGDGDIILYYDGGVMVEGGTAVWYDDAALTNVIGTGNALTIPAPVVTTTYFVRFEGTCDISPAVSTTITVKTLTVDPVAAFVDRNSVCAGDGSIVLSYIGGDLGSNGTAEWYDDAGFTSSVGSGNNLSIAVPMTTTTYYLRFEADCDNSSAVSVEVTVWPIPEPVFVEMTENVCVNGPLYRYVAGGFAGSVFTWSITNGTIVSQDNDTVYVDWGTQILTGTIEVTETSINGCISAPVSLQVEVGGPDLDLGADVGTCVGTAITIDPTGDFDSYLWQDGSTGSDYTTDQEGWIVLSVTDSYGCESRDSIYLTIYDLPVVDLGPDIIICGDEGLTLDAGTDGIYYEWSTGEISQEITVFMGGPEEYRVEVENVNGCIGGDTINVKKCSVEFYFRDIPTAITPGDGNGLNDFWEIDILASFSQAVVEIFDRWGTLVWRSEPGYSNPWDGRNMKGNEMPMDSYHFVIELNTGAKEDHVTGIITIIR